MADDDSPTIVQMEDALTAHLQSCPTCKRALVEPSAPVTHFDAIIESFYPMPVGIDDACNACGQKDVRGATWGYGKPVLCEDCMKKGIACLALPRGKM